MAAFADLDAVIERYHAAIGDFIQGRAEGFETLYSRGDDATLANPFGPPARGWSQISRTLAVTVVGGEVRGVETVARVVTAELAYTVEMERFTARVGGSEEARPVTLRVTTVFRPEDGAWRIVHRHADPIAAPRGADSVVETSRARRS